MTPFDSRSARGARAPLAQGGPAGTALLWILTCASGVLLVYEAWTLVGSVLRPLIANPQIIQTDFHYYYEAALRFRQDRMLLYLVTDDVIAGFTYPPPAIVPFLWLSRWPLGTALLAFTILSYLMIFVAMQQWLKYLRAHGHAIERPVAIAIMVIAFALGPTYMNAIFGQVNAFVLASAVVFVRLAPVSAVEAGFVLALGAWLKIYPALMAAIGIWDRKTWRAIGWSVAAAAAIAMVLLPVVPLQSYAGFVSQVLPARIDKTAIHVTNQSLVAFLERFRLSSDLFLYWTGREAITVSGVVRAINLGIPIGAVLVLARHSMPPALKAASLVALVAVIAPLGWGHTYVMVLPLVALRLVTMTQSGAMPAATIAICVGALMIPAGRHLPIDAAPDWIQNILYSRYLISTVILMVISSNRALGHQTEQTIISRA
jgi:hypothetical protein